MLLQAAPVRLATHALFCTCARGMVIMQYS